MESQVKHGPGAMGPNRAPMGAPAMSVQNAVDSLEWAEAEPARGGRNTVVMVVAGAALLVAVGGMVKSMMSPKAEAPVAAGAAPTYFSEQARMMREAMNMAREAQSMQRERMEMMRQEMTMQEEAYGGEMGGLGAEMGMGEDGE